MNERTYRVAGLSFDHMHMGDLLRMVFEHPRARIVGVCDAQPERMWDAVERFSIPSEAVFTDPRRCLETVKPDLVILCPSTLQHAEWVERVAPFGPHVLVEKPFAASLADADRMIAAMKPGQRLAINWPLRWVPSHITAKQLIDDGVIGDVIEVHYYDGNRGPLFHAADKVEVRNPAEKTQTWWYQHARGGGSLLDYLGYGVTLGAWFDGGRAPVEVTCLTGGDPALEVDEHSVTVCRYADGRLSKFETRWGTFTDPWVHQPTPRCGFNLVGTRGTIATQDYAPTIWVQTAERPGGYEVPSVQPKPPFQNPVQYLIHCLDHGLEIEGPLSPRLARLGQQIVDAACRSAREKRAVKLAEGM
ncbi:MAG: Gfo/Idh/MocA family oxidoreductase [Verrucomicrobia bacterium]|nr:Gfo/Idh/MocA family oxidoreductase [Verrucomicrobiota bacterium]